MSLDLTAEEVVGKIKNCDMEFACVFRKLNFWLTTKIWNVEWNMEWNME